MSCDAVVTGAERNQQHSEESEPPTAIREQLDRSRLILGCRKDQIWHLIGMRFSLNDIALRSPAEPSFPPIQEPPDPPENPEAPLRQPDPAEPAEI
jgi:hypothetical protein